MANDYAPKLFFWQARMLLLGTYFSKRRLLTEVNWDDAGPDGIETAYTAYRALPMEQRIEVEGDFRRVHAMATAEGIVAIIDEGTFHKLDLKPDLECQDGHLNKALWTLIEHRSIFEVAARIWRADHLNGRYWRMRTDLPRKEPDVSSAARASLAAAVGTYFQERQGRGSPCHVEAYLQGNRYHYLFVYSNDFADTYMQFDAAGQFKRGWWNPAFETIFVYDGEDGTLEIYVQGAKALASDLQEIFGRIVLGEEIGPELPGAVPYNLEGFKRRDFPFARDVQDCIREVKITSMRLALRSNPKSRITLDVDPQRDPQAIHWLIDSVLDQRQCPLNSLIVRSVVLRIIFSNAAPISAPGTKLDFRITYPDGCSLKNSPEELIAKKCVRRWTGGNRELLQVAWRRAEDVEAQFTAAEVRLWPEDQERVLVAAGIICADAPATSVSCEACTTGHVEELELVESPAGSQVRAYMYCPSVGRIFIPSDRLKQWRMDFAGLVTGIASGLGLSGNPDEVVPGRLWFLGKSTFAGRSRELFLARGLTWSDARDVFTPCERLNASASPVLVTPAGIPRVEWWAGDAPPILLLETVAQLDGDRLFFDRDHIESALRGKRRSAPVKAIRAFPTPAGATWSDVYILVGDLQLSVEVKGKRQPYKLEQAGFEEKRRRQVPDLYWGLLTAFASCGGSLPKGTARLDFSIRSNLANYVSDLRERVRALVPGIDGDPIPFDRERDCYRTEFQIAAESGVSIDVPVGTDWPEIRITLDRAGALLLTVPRSESFTARDYSGSEEDDAPAWALAQRGSVEVHRLHMRQLGLADELEQMDARGNLLLELLRAGGSVRRPPDDRDMTQLVSFLAHLLPSIDSPSFRYIPASKEWVARFQAEAPEP